MIDDAFLIVNEDTNCDDEPGWRQILTIIVVIVDSGDSNNDDSGDRKIYCDS